ncbi:hypothetical protein BJF86_04860 [Serinicoccus sp. CNJ-927]|nr:hypothetical protein BJF86_04860 [Serinicoccus sp. CNJ-927]
MGGAGQDAGGGGWGPCAGTSMSADTSGERSCSIRTTVRCIHTRQRAVSRKMTKKVDVGKPDQAVV